MTASSKQPEHGDPPDANGPSSRSGTSQPRGSAHAPTDGLADPMARQRVISEWIVPALRDLDSDEMLSRPARQSAWALAVVECFVPTFPGFIHACVGGDDADRELSKALLNGFALTGAQAMRGLYALDERVIGLQPAQAYDALLSLIGPEYGSWVEDVPTDLAWNEAIDELSGSLWWLSVQVQLIEGLSSGNQEVMIAQNVDEGWSLADALATAEESFTDVLFHILKVALVAIANLNHSST